MTLRLELSDETLDELADAIAERVALRVPAEHREKPWRLLSLEEVAAMLGRSTRSVHIYVKERGLAFIRLDGGALAFDPDDVKAWARARRVPAAEDDPLAGRWQGERKAASLEGTQNGARTAMQRVRP